MKKFFFLLLAASSLGGLPVVAAPYHYTPVAWIIQTRNNMDVDDRYVTIIGRVTRRISGEEYWFSDGSGSVKLDSARFDLPVGPRVIIGGRIDQAYLGFGDLEVDVRRWRYAPLHPAPVKQTVTTRTVRTTTAVSPPPASAATPAPAVVSTPAANPAPTAPPLAPPQTGQ